MLGCALKARIEFLEDFLPRQLDINLEVLQHKGRDPVACPKQAKEDMLGPDVSVLEPSSFLGCKRQDLLQARRIGNVTQYLLARTGPDLFLDFPPHALEINAHFLKDVDRHALAEPDHAKQQMFGVHEVVVEAVGFLACKRQHLLGARRKVAWHLDTPTFTRRGVARSFPS